MYAEERPKGAFETRRQALSGVKRFDNGARRAVEPAAHSRESGSASSSAGPGRPSSRGSGTIGTPTRKDANDQAPGVQVQDRSPAGHQSVGPAEEPDQQARLRPGPAWPAAQEAL